jgi:hypothetical protein
MHEIVNYTAVKKKEIELLSRYFLLGYYSALICCADVSIFLLQMIKIRQFDLQ